jgi:hypothetical protein
MTNAGEAPRSRRLRRDGCEELAAAVFDGEHHSGFGAVALFVDGGLAGDGSSVACPANNLFYLNSQHLFYKILKGGNTKFEAFTVKDNSINKTSVFYHIYNLTTNLPSSLGRFTAITG